MSPRCPHTIEATTVTMTSIVNITKVLSIMLCLILQQATVTLSLNTNYINRNQARDQEHNILGHHNFEMAPPGVEPPTVSKGPYVHSEIGCKGSVNEPWAQFSVKDTLCGDLNKGFIPRNPLAQYIDNEPYPWELIKTKTLQFLANALPTLKADYQTIPKVARYIPDFNPTNVHNAMSFEQLHHLNQLNGVKIGNSGPASPPVNTGSSHSLAGQDISQYLARAKRSLVTAPSQSSSLSHSSVTTANNMMKTHNGVNNRMQNDAEQQQHNNNNNNNGYHHHNQATIISKDGYRNVTIMPISPVASLASSSRQQQSIASASYGVNGQASGSNSAKPPPVGGAAATASLGFAPDNTNNTIYRSSPDRQMEMHARDNSNSNLMTSSGSNSDKSVRSASSNSQSAASSNSQQQSINPNKYDTAAHSSKTEKSKQQQQSATSCSDLPTWSGLVCQAALALIDGEKSSLLSTVKQVANVYNSATDAASSSSSLWSAMTSMFQDSNNGKASLTSGRIPSFLSAMSSSNVIPDQMTKDNNNNVAGVGNGHSLASSAISHLVEYLLPFSSTVARRRNNIPSETFAETPASAASTQNAVSAQQLTSGSNNNNNAVANNNRLTSNIGSAGSYGKPPPTPCQSNEEYISPTFARNYQGAWKYVVQIPHEGYFTQTIQKTTCVQPRCDYTEGVCHESPRWISLLVAEIFYPHTLFSHNGMTGNVASHQTDIQQQHQQQQQAVPALSASSVHIAQLPNAAINSPKPMNNDPLQMTDTFQNINYQFNNPFGNGADAIASADAQNSATMQSLANSFQQYQLLQRQGLIPNSQTYGLSYNQPNPANQQQQQQQKLMNNQYLYNTAPSYGSSMSPYLDYASAIMGANQNSLLSKKRKRRDVNNNVPKSMMVPHSNNNDNIPSSNDLQMIGHTVGQVTQMQHPPHLLAGQQPIQQQQQQQHHQQQQQQQQPPANFNQRNQQTFNNNIGPDSVPSAATTTSSGDNQVECDGHDKMGCYVVRVYYDWFLVNGSCKCWKTLPSTTNSNPSNSFIRRILSG